MSQLGNALFTTTQQKVLGLLYAHPDKSFYTKEIIRLTGMGVATIKRELDRMLAAGILSMNKIGNQHHYQANKSCPIYSDLLNIVRKTFGVADVLQEALEPLNSQIDLAFVYGSMSKGMDTASSDIDLLVVTESLVYADLMNVLTDAESLLGRPINPSIYTAQQIKKKIKQKNAFLTRLMEQPKLWVKGSDDDIKEFRQLSKNKTIKN